ncbi:MAG: hypothetical protein Q9195_002797 [Heterodermia aff. obscurata]
MSPAGMFSPITTTSTEAEPPLQKSPLPTQRPISKSPGIKDSTIPSQQLQPAAYTYSSSSSLVEYPQTTCHSTKKIDPLFNTSNFTYEDSIMGLTKFSSSADGPPHFALKNSAAVAAEHMPNTTYTNRVFSTIFPLLDGSSMGSAAQATASLQDYNSPYDHLTAPAILSPDNFVKLGSKLAPDIPLTREHATSPAIQQRLLKIRDNRIRQESQNTCIDPSDLASIKPPPAFEASHHPDLNSSSQLIKPPILEDFLVAGGLVPGLHRDSQKVSVEDNGQRSHFGHDMATPLQSLPERNFEFFVPYGKESPNFRQMSPRPNTERERTNTPAVSINPQSRNSLDVFASPGYNTYASSTSVSPEASFSLSPQQTFGTPASSEPNNTSKNNTPNSMISEQTRMLLTENPSHNSISTPSSKSKKRKLSHGPGLQKECESSSVIPVDVKSASRSEGKRRKHEREASARYRKKKKARKSAEPPEKLNKSVAISTNSSDAKEPGTDGSMNLAPPTSTEMALSSSQQSFSSNLSGSTQVSTPSSSTKVTSQGTNCDGWPDLPELHHYERRRKINYGPLAPYGSPETIQTYPPSFQASLHRVMDFQKIEHLKSTSHRVLFVYGSLMISDLWHDVFETPTEWIFHNEIVKKCMCPAKVPGYSRFALRGASDEPVMVKADKSASSVWTHGMLIFGLSAADFRVLDRYLAEGFVREQVSAYVTLKSSSANFEVEAYAWPREPETRGTGRRRGSREEEWSVERFWAESRLCRIYRETVEEQQHGLLLVKAQQAASVIPND